MSSKDPVLASRRNQWKPWVPVALWLGILALESSDLGSSEHTGGILRAIWNFFLGAPDPDTFEFVHHLIRKSGHFLGYGILSWLIFRALRAGWHNRQQILSRGREYSWQLRWAILAIAGTAFTASLDEIHQTFNPARTGRWQDVVIDTSGALVIQIILFLSLTLNRRSGGTRHVEA